LSLRDVNPFETANAGFAQALYEEFLRDPGAVSPEWRRVFESGMVGERPPAGISPNGAMTSSAAPVPDPKPEAALPGIEVKGPAARLVANMHESLGVPTATTFRQLPVAALEARRTAINAALAAAGRTEKVSFTHLIGFAIAQAARAYPVMGHSYRVVEGTGYRVTPEHVHLGLAVDVERKDGSRGLVVPVIRQADAMDFATFLATYESLVERARGNKLMPDDFVGATMTLTNPGGLGTSASVPRLMAGQGTIVAIGSIAHPAAFTGVPKDRLRELGIAKVMTVTSTYDHRVIQGAESGEFLRQLDQLLQGADQFYEAAAGSLGLSPEALPALPPDQAAPKAAPRPAASPAQLSHVAAAMFLVDAIRTHGHLAAHVDPLGSEPRGDPALDPAGLGLTPDVMATVPTDVLHVWVPGATLAEALPHLQAIYCGTLAYEVEHVSNHQERAWLRQVIESGAHRTPLDAESQRRLLQRLTEVESLERFLHKAYLGQKRFSIEGVDMMVPMLDLAIEMAADSGAAEVVLGMAHRGRLNVLAHTLGRPYVTLFSEFEGLHHTETGDEFGTGDVKYHIGAEGAHQTASGKAVTVTLAHNPSHLEFVAPVVVGRTRAEQTQRRGQQAALHPDAALPVVIHGDAAFAGQGVVAETLNLGALKGYAVGGTLHLIANNQVGFTTDIGDSRSTTHASDLAKGFDVPIIHVNADDAEACLDAMRLAMMYRHRFHQDILIDLVGYRRHGHNEGDEPGYTQPRMYGVIKAHPTVRERYAARVTERGVIGSEEAAALYDAAYQRLTAEQQGLKASIAGHAPAETGPRRVSTVLEPDTRVPAETLAALNESLLTWPEGFAVHPKLQRQLDRRRQVLGADGGIEWAHAESLAFASLLAEGAPIRLTGQDTERGTFSQRHLVLHDVNTGATWTPLQHLRSALAPFELHNSPLSELATLGFEYGYSAAAPDVLVLWEAQFGDFVNGAQVILDQFMAAGLAKWGVTTKLTLLLPHGYEGQGPEHSSARIERFLQLAAEGNLRVANCTTPAQYYHLLRRQALRARIRPLVVFTPKSLLRHPQAVSSLEDLAADRFHKVLDDRWAAERPQEIIRLVLCTGKVFYDLLPEAEGMTVGRPALTRLEQLYSFPDFELRELFGRYPNLREVVWAQEEPRNMGAWDYLDDKLMEILPAGVTLRYAGRPERASPAEGYPAAHAAEQGRLVADALGKS
jgi:2-oxoglutarate dehydrogenase E1 component